LIKKLINSFFNKNDLFISQIGWLQYQKKRFKQLKIRAFNESLVHQIKQDNGCIIEYKIPKWDPSGNEVFLTEGLSDWGLEKLFLTLTVKGGIFIDVGAHTGYFAHLFYNKCEKFFLIETSEKCVSECLLPIKHNWKDKQVTVINAPAFNKSNVEIEISQSDDGWGMSELNNAKGYQKTKNSITKMMTITVDEVIKSSKTQNRVNAIKIDVDGPALEVLEGSLNTIEKFRPIVFIENSEKRLLEICNNIRYECFTLVANRNLPNKMIFEKLELNKGFSNLWTKMCLLIPKEDSKFVNSFVGFSRNNHDKKHLFEGF
jgi:FkbM family methyltransferase